jgi:hypothetical protein
MFVPERKVQLDKLRTLRLTMEAVERFERLADCGVLQGIQDGKLTNLILLAWCCALDEEPELKLEDAKPLFWDHVVVLAAPLITMVGEMFKRPTKRAKAKKAGQTS